LIANEVVALGSPAEAPVSVIVALPLVALLVAATVRPCRS
jgi:hypothetical protein